MKNCKNAVPARGTPHPQGSKAASGCADIEMELCLPCREELRSDGRIVRVAQGGVDRKARCSLCGRMRYATRYTVSKEVMG